MDSIPPQRYLKFHPDTLSYIRSQYNLDKPGEMDRAIDLLEQWLLKQNHFTVKTFPRSFLERQIILDKGSVERTKKQMDRLFTMKTIVTSFLGKYDVKDGFDELRGVFIQTLLPKLTKDHYRVFCGKPRHNNLSPQIFVKVYQFAINIFEYIRAFDYCNGFIGILDYRDIEIMNLVAAINVTELRQLIGYVMQGYQMRLKGLHILTKSKAVDVLLRILRPMFSEKVGQRIQVHMTLDSLYEHVPKEILPADFGGDEKSFLDLYDEFTNELATKENIEYFKEMGKAVVNESLRIGDKTSTDDILGISGSFRGINVD